MLEGLGKQVLEQLGRTGLLDLIGEENVYLGQPLFGAALREAVAAAEAWIEQGSTTGSPRATGIAQDRQSQ